MQQSNQSVWRRALLDTKASFSAVWFYVIGAVVLATTGLVLADALTAWSVAAKIPVFAVGAAGAASLMLGSVYVWSAARAPLRQRNELRAMQADAEAPDEVGRIADELAEKPIILSDGASTDFGSVLLALRHELALGLRTRDLDDLAFRNLGGHFGNVEPNDFLAELQSARHHYDRSSGARTRKP